MPVKTHARESQMECIRGHKGFESECCLRVVAEEPSLRIASCNCEMFKICGSYAPAWTAGSDVWLGWLSWRRHCLTLGSGYLLQAGSRGCSAPGHDATSCSLGNAGHSSRHACTGSLFQLQRGQALTADRRLCSRMQRKERAGLSVETQALQVWLVATWCGMQEGG